MAWYKHPIVGNVSFQAIGGGRIRLLNNWEARNISTVFIPELKGVPTYGGKFSGNVRFYASAIPQLKAAFAEIGAKGLAGDIIFWDGSFVPRMKRGSSTSPSNHCLPSGEMVWTAEGAKPIEELRHYDGLVWSYKDGEAVQRRVTAFFDNGVKDIVRVNCVGHSFRCTADHPVLVLRKKTLPKSEWIQHSNTRGQQRAKYWTEMVNAGDLRRGERVVSLRRLPDAGTFEADAAWAEVLGLFIGDGCVGHRKGDPVYVAFSIPKGDRIRSHAIELLTRCFGEAPKIDERNLIYYKPHIVARFEPYDKRAIEKTVPPEVWAWVDASKVAFARGYLYSDGTAAKTMANSGGGHGVRYCFKAASKRLIQDMKFLLTGLGFRCGRVHTEAPCDTVICGVPTRSNGAWHFGAIDVRGIMEPNADSLYSERVSSANASKQGDSHCWGYESVAPDYTHHCVQEVVADGREAVYDITVEDTHNFITDGVVVSNCFGTAFDINAEWNGFRRKPAAPGTKGSVWRLVPIFKKYGFECGAEWRNTPDGMHFEIERLMSASEVAQIAGNVAPQAKVPPVAEPRPFVAVLNNEVLAGARIENGVMLAPVREVLDALGFVVDAVNDRISERNRFDIRAVPKE